MNCFKASSHSFSTTSTLPLTPKAKAGTALSHFMTKIINVCSCSARIKAEPLDIAQHDTTIAAQVAELNKQAISDRITLKTLKPLISYINNSKSFSLKDLEFLNAERQKDEIEKHNHLRALTTDLSEIMKSPYAGVALKDIARKTLDMPIDGVKFKEYGCIIEFSNQNRIDENADFALIKYELLILLNKLMNDWAEARTERLIELAA